MVTLFGKKTVQVACTTTGTTPVSQVILTDLDGYQPVGVDVEIVGATVAGTVTDGARIGRGMTDGVSQFAFSVFDADGRAVATQTKAGGRCDNATLIQFCHAGTNARNGEARWDAWAVSGGDNGVEILWDDLPSSAWLMNVTFFYGELAQAYVALEEAATTSGNSVSPTGAGFQGNVLLAMSANVGFTADLAFNSARYYDGWACNNDGAIEQACVSLRCRHNYVTSSKVAPAIRDDAIIQTIEIDASGVVTYPSRIVVTSFDSDGWTMQSLGDDITIKSVFMLLDTGANRVASRLLDLDTATVGTKSISLGFEPKGAKFVGTGLSV